MSERATKDEGPILVVSNRLPITLQRGPRGLEQRRSSGGLVSALEPALARRGGTWNHLVKLLSGRRETARTHHEHA